MKPIQPANCPPASVDELLARAHALAGLSLGELADLASIATPQDLRRHKGWSGQLLELWLGAQAGSKPQQDFPQLGVELKTLPIDEQGRPLETTYVCYAPLTGIAGLTWETSNVRNKLSQVCWIPIEASRHIPPAQRRVATAFLWSPCAQEERLLRQDWEELMDLIALGQIENISARHGQVLQLRPKAADGSALTQAVGTDGQFIMTRPRGFYLKKPFTQSLLNQAFC
ncbi:DNA mismatch repair endonuclease MutH [Aliiglaciecola sp. CAU 1673]|uniref:DNA mismatch repair endonuclease MutH n=1 Tax=Aliiglaciecola sp. CAU 1673 TaxID=3032595 RepID=UPI0023DB2DB8|nr:DNA mismatch repair endonuclease MutH [Aliiglaciecola sp. CAU 1673]MDF2178991.1 DNA mismatch repair endonuclease MutH [Aliiglaciecola sp. CAU 1673]